MTGGMVILVGAGPGNAGLLTLRGKEALESADAVLYDRLVGTGILAMIPDTAIKIDVGKKAGQHPVPQQEINGMLLRLAKEGKRVVRLKGGDPYLFGRGAEELEGVIEAGIPFEVVPGVTSALSVPAYAGIPVSHRDISSSVHIITAHRKNSQAPGIDYESLVKLGGTLIFLMGLETVGDVMAGLEGAGMAAATPAALIENGTRPNQRGLIATVAEITARAKKEAFQSPSVLIVGGVCALADQLDWFSRLPLRGAKVLVTRPSGDDLLSRGLRGLGAEVTDFPCIVTEPLPVSKQTLASAAEYEWIVFTSPTGAKLFFDALRTHTMDVRFLHGVKFAAVGPKTAAVLRNRSVCVAYMPDIYNANALAAGLPMEAGGAGRVLLFRARDGSPELVTTLKARGFLVEDVAAYTTIRRSDCAEDISAMLSRNAADFITFTSASTVQGFVDSVPGASRSGATAVCIGKETAAEAGKHGFHVITSREATIESMIACIREAWSR